MPLTLQKLQSDTATATLVYSGETINLTYRPSKYTPSFLAQLAALQDKPTNQESMDEAIGMVMDILLDWDIYDMPEDEGGVKVPITHEFLSQLEFFLLMSLLGACSEDALLGKRTGQRQKKG